MDQHALHLFIGQHTDGFVEVLAERQKPARPPICSRLSVRR